MRCFARREATNPRGRICRRCSPEVKHSLLARSAPIKAAAPLLAGALRDLGAATSELVVSLPKLEACSPSLLEASTMVSANASLLLVAAEAPAMDVVDTAIAAIAEESTAAVAAVVSAATSALAPYEHL